MSKRRGKRDKGKSNLRFPTLPMSTYEHVHAAGPELLSCHFQSDLCVRVYILRGPGARLCGAPWGRRRIGETVWTTSVQTEKDGERDKTLPVRWMHCHDSVRRNWGCG